MGYNMSSVFTYSYDNTIEKSCIPRVLHHSVAYAKYNMSKYDGYKFMQCSKMDRDTWRKALFYIYKPITDYENAVDTSIISYHITRMFCYSHELTEYNENMEKYCPEIERRELRGLTSCENIYKWYEYKLAFIDESSVRNCWKYHNHINNTITLL